MLKIHGRTRLAKAALVAALTTGVLIGGGQAATAAGAGTAISVRPAYDTVNWQKLYRCAFGSWQGNTWKDAECNLHASSGYRLVRNDVDFYGTYRYAPASGNYKFGTTNQTMCTKSYAQYRNNLGVSAQAEQCG